MQRILYSAHVLYAQDSKARSRQKFSFDLEKDANNKRAADH
jgi:hypothetical protein